MTHPHIQLWHTAVSDTVFDTFEKCTWRRQVDLGVTELGCQRRLYVAAELLGKRLHSVTDSEQRNPHIKQLQRRAWSPVCCSSFRSARQNHAARRKVGNLPSVTLVIPHLTV